MRSKQTDVHTEHCCVLHGCKYLDSACSVVMGLKKQSHKCELCDDTIRDIEDHLDFVNWCIQMKFKNVTRKDIECWIEHKIKKIIPMHTTEMSDTERDAWAESGE